ncbi:hypothetical protein BDV93DRAFT_417158, partial [Ceratobasidium sp. AG-I]
IEVDPLCRCGRGVGFDGPEWKVPAWRGLLPYATKAAISLLFGVSDLETVPHDVCWQCGNIGRPLLLCQRCKKAQYCSEGCQKIHWKEKHRHICRA